MHEIKIKEVKVDSNIKPIKSMTFRGMGFIIPCKLILEDGREIDSSLDNTKKKLLPDTIARAQKAATENRMAANFNDNGEFWGTVVRGL